MIGAVFLALVVASWPRVTRMIGPALVAVLVLVVHVSVNLGRFGTALVQGLYIMLLTLIIFQVDWGDPIGAVPADRPVGPGDVAATILPMPPRASSLSVAYTLSSTRGSGASVSTGGGGGVGIFEGGGATVSANASESHAPSPPAIA